MMQEVLISDNLERDLTHAIDVCAPDKLFVLTDKTTNEHCWPKIEGFDCVKGAKLITIPSTDEHKNIETLSMVWEMLSEQEGTRRSCLINLGGGMVTDLGGFAAATFKRGISFINIPTTLLAMVDAAVGGKTGINFNGLKNEIGAFCNARFVLLNTLFLDTLDDKNTRSGYAEMLKHGLISNERMWAELLNFDLGEPNWGRLQQMVAQSVKVKEEVVAKDPHEQGLRKALNLGHTVGHAFESMALHRGQPVLHGYAVAFGLVCELYLSTFKTNFPTSKMRQTVQFIRSYYGTFPLSCNDYDGLIELMQHDKKNTSAGINFTFLENIGKPIINQTATRDEIKEALDFFRETM